MSELLADVTDSTFEQLVLQSDRPALVDFWAVWCGPCRALAPTLEQVAEKYSGNAIVVKLNVDENPQTTGQYGIKSIPTLILFSGGREEQRIVGSASRDTISRLIDKYVNSATTA